MVKLLVFGKGGSGKSTLTALIAGNLARRGFRVLVVDCDESNMTLHRMLGINTPRRTLVEYLGGRKKVSRTLFRGEGSIDWGMLGTTITSLPKQCVEWSGRIGLLTIGKITGYQEGCACPLQALAREFLGKISLGECEAIVVDTDAGVEHFGRGLEEACNPLLMIVDPTYESIVLAGKASEMASKAGKKLYYVLNKVDNTTTKIIKSKIGEDKIIAVLPYYSELVELCLEGKPIIDFPVNLDNLVSKIISF